MRIDIRPATLSDVEGMSRVLDECWRVNYSALFSPEKIAQYTGEYRRRSFTKLIVDGKYNYVLLVDGEVCSVCAGECCENKAFDGCVMINMLYTTPEMQRKGYGKKLLMHFLREMRKKGYKGAVLETAEENVNARRFYEKFGFSERKSSAREYDGVKYVTYKIDF